MFRKFACAEREGERDRKGKIQRTIEIEIPRNIEIQRQIQRNNQRLRQGDRHREREMDVGESGGGRAANWASVVGPFGIILDVFSGPFGGQLGGLGAISSRVGAGIVLRA